MAQGRTEGPAGKGLRDERGVPRQGSREKKDNIKQSEACKYV